MSTRRLEHAMTDAPSVTPERDRDEEVAARLAAGAALEVIVSDDSAERTARLGAVLALAASAGARTRRVGNGLQAPLTLARIAFQLVNDGSAAMAGSAGADDGLVNPAARTILAVEHAETLAPKALAAVRSLPSVSLLLVGSSALHAMLATAGLAPDTGAVGRSEPSPTSGNPAFGHDPEPAEDEAWHLDDADPEEHDQEADPWHPEPMRHTGDEATAPVLRAEPRPASSPSPASRRSMFLLGSLALAGCAAIAAAVFFASPARRAPDALAAAVPPSAPVVSAPVVSSPVSPSADDAAADATPPAPVAATPPLAEAPGRGASPPTPPANAAPAPASKPADVPAHASGAAIPALPRPTPATAPHASPPPTEAMAQLRREFETFLEQPDHRRQRLGPAQKNALFAQYLTWRGRQAAAGAAPATAPPAPGAKPTARIVLHVPPGAPTENSPRLHLLIGLLGGLGRVETRIVGEQPEKPSVRYFYPEDAQAARQVAVTLDKAEPGWESRDFTSYRPRPVQGTIEVWAPQG